MAVARLGSFSAAAIELGYTQAAISQQIAALENDLKVCLLNRRPVTPTEAGARLLEHAEPILLRLDAARADVTRMTRPPSDTLVVGMTPLAGGSRVLPLPLALATLRQRMPRLEVTVQLAARGDPLAEFASLTAVGVSQAGVAVVVPGDHPLAGRGGLRLTDLADARWIEAPAVAAPLAEIRRLAGVEGFRSAFRYDGPDTLSLIRLAAAGHGLVLLPETALPVTGITAVPVTTPRVVHRVELAHGTLRAGSPAAELASLLADPA